MTVEYTFGYIDNFEPSENYPQVKKTLSLNFQEGDTWTNVVEHFLIFLEEVYGYDIRPRVYYSVALPTNNEAMTKAVGREMSQEVFEKMADIMHDELFPYQSFESDDDECVEWFLDEEELDTTEEDKADENTRNS